MIVAFEGIDASGKATQVRMLKKYAEDKGIPVKCLSFPNYETGTGKKIAELLKDPNRDPLVLQAMMSVNRYEAQPTIGYAQARGELVILDRYWMSGLVYGAGDGLDKNWLWVIHQQLIQPHQWFITDINIPESFKRRPAREDDYEADKGRLVSARMAYLAEAARTPNVRILNAMRTPEQVHQEVVENLEL